MKRATLVLLVLALTTPVVAQGDSHTIDVRQRGRVRSADGGPVSDVRIKVRNVETPEGLAVARTQTAPRGAYALRYEVPEDAERPMIARRAGFQPRRTWVEITDKRRFRKNFNMIPLEYAKFFDHVTRVASADDTVKLGTLRWLTEPTYRFWDTVMECTNSTCSKLRAGRPVPQWFLEGSMEILPRGLRLLSGGFITGEHVERYRVERGTVIESNMTMNRTDDNIVEIIVVDMPGAGFAGLAHNRGPNFQYQAVNFSFPIGSAMVYLNAGSIGVRYGTLMHEVAHTLGMGHPLGLSAVPLDSIMDQGRWQPPYCHSAQPQPSECWMPTVADRVWGRASYDRSYGNIWPDKDPRPSLLHQPEEIGSAESSSTAGAEVAAGLRPSVLHICPHPSNREAKGSSTRLLFEGI